MNFKPVFALALLLTSSGSIAGNFTPIERRNVIMPGAIGWAKDLAKSTKSEKKFIRALHEKLEFASGPVKEANYRAKIIQTFIESAEPEAQMKALSYIKNQPALSDEALILLSTAYLHSKYAEIKEEAASIMRGDKK